MKQLRTVFMGTPDFAVPCLAELCKITQVIGVVTQPDKPRGRGQHMTPSPVKAFAAAQGIPVYQPVRIKAEDFIPVLEGLAPDLIVVVAFGQILSQRILDIPPLGCINVHASLLPRYRGAAPMQWCLIHGETKTGVTTMFMDAGLDTGDMLLRDELTTSPDMNMTELHDALMEKGAQLLARTITALQAGNLTPEKQEDSASNYAPMLTKETGKIDWSKSAAEIHDLVRALDSWPGAYCFLDGAKFKIWRTKASAVELAAMPGEIVSFTSDGMLVGTGNGLLEILELQAPSKKRMSVKDYLRGHEILLHACFA